MNDLEAAIGQAGAQKIRQSAILFDRQNSCAGGEQGLGDCAETRPDFHHKIRRGNPSLLHHPARQILIVQEILPERFHRHNANLAQGISNFRKLHRQSKKRRRLSREEDILFTAFCEQYASKVRIYSQVIQAGVLRSTPPPRKRNAKHLPLRAGLRQRFLLFAW